MTRKEIDVAEATIHIRDNCLCLHAQRAARALARRFDDALRPYGITSGQFSLLNALNRREPMAMGPVAKFLAMEASLNSEAFYRRNGFKTTGYGKHRIGAAGIDMACVHMMMKLG